MSIYQDKARIVGVVHRLEPTRLYNLSVCFPELKINMALALPWTCTADLPAENSVYFSGVSTRVLFARSQNIVSDRVTSRSVVHTKTCVFFSPAVITILYRTNLSWSFTSFRIFWGRNNFSLAPGCWGCVINFVQSAPPSAVLNCRHLRTLLSSRL